MIKIKAKITLYKDKVVRRLQAKENRILKGTGGSTRTTMRRGMRKARKPKFAKRIATTDSKGRRAYVTVNGAVRLESGRYLTKKEARAAKKKVRKLRGKQTDGGGSKPGESPRYRSGGLKNSIIFIVHDRSVTIAPQLKSRGFNVIKLLNQGGSALVTLPGGEKERAHYKPRPFATGSSPAFREGLKTFREKTEQEPL